MRLRLLEQELGGRLKVRHKAFMLRPDWTPNQYPKPYVLKAMERVQENAADVGLVFGRWPADRYAPAGSLPAQVAAKCAALQGAEAFRRMDLALLKAYFEDLVDISQRDELMTIARDCNLDMNRFQADFDSGALEPAVFSEHAEAVQRYGINGVPTIIINDRYQVVGAQPLATYRAIFDQILSGALEARLG